MCSAQHDVYTSDVYPCSEAAMTIARIFQSGNSQAVRLPKEFRFQVGSR